MRVGYRRLRAALLTLNAAPYEIIYITNHIYAYAEFGFIWEHNLCHFIRFVR